MTVLGIGTVLGLKTRFTLGVNDDAMKILILGKMIINSFAYCQNARTKTFIQRVEKVTIMLPEAIPVIINRCMIKNPCIPHFGTSYYAFMRQLVWLF